MYEEEHREENYINHAEVNAGSRGTDGANAGDEARYGNAADSTGTDGHSRGGAQNGDSGYSYGEAQNGDSGYSYGEARSGADGYSYRGAPGGSGGYSYGTQGGNGNGQNGGNNYYNPYSSAYGSNPTPNDGGKKNKNRGNKKRGAGGKAALALVIAGVFGICVGAGAIGLQTLRGSADTAVESSAARQDDASDASQQEATGTTEDSSQAVTLKTSSSDGQTGSAGTVTDVSDIAAAAMPSIVSVYNSATVTQQDFFGQVYTSEEESTGSGIIIAETDTELLIATNNHVVADADELKVQFIDNTTAGANIKGTDSDNDLAVIAVKLSDIDSGTLSQIAVATIGDSDALKVGEPAIAIGNALGYGQSVTAGVISAVDRELQISDTATNTFIQTDAAINPGNSGGALLNSKGEVIGINSNKIGGTEVEGMGYAIPMSRAIPIIEQLMNQETREKVSSDEQGYLGIRGISVTQQVASAYNMPRGVYVASVIENTGAAKSDLQSGDIITAVNGTKISGMDDLTAQLAYYKAGTDITLTVERANNGSYVEQKISLTLSDKKAVKNSTGSSSDASGSSGSRDRGSGQTESGQNDSEQDEEQTGAQDTDGSGSRQQSPYGYFFNNGQN